jgi:proteasome alpha subunit
MSMPYYVSPEQMYQERADFARKGISRGRPIVALEYESGVMLMAENRSSTLRKISEIYDRIAFGGVGKLDEYENLRKSGVRYADTKGYTFSRDDVSGKSLAAEYSTVLGSIFTREMKPFEVEILVVELLDDAKAAFYQISYDGSMVDRSRCAAIGGDSEDLLAAVDKSWREGMSLEEVAALARKALAEVGNGSVADDLNEDSLEVAVLDRNREGRKFKRLTPEETRKLFGG